MPFDPNAPAFVPRSFTSPSPPLLAPSSVPSSSEPPRAPARKPKPKKKKAVSAAAGPSSTGGPSPSPPPKNGRSSAPAAKPPTFGESDFPSLGPHAGVKTDGATGVDAASPAPSAPAAVSAPKAGSWASAAAKAPAVAPPPKKTPAAAVKKVESTSSRTEKPESKSAAKRKEEKAKEEETFTYPAESSRSAPVDLPEAPSKPRRSPPIPSPPPKGFSYATAAAAPAVAPVKPRVSPPSPAPSRAEKEKTAVKPVAEKPTSVKEGLTAFEASSPSSPGPLPEPSTAGATSEPATSRSAEPAPQTPSLEAADLEQVPTPPIADLESESPAVPPAVSAPVEAEAAPPTNSLQSDVVGSTSAAVPSSKEHPTGATATESSATKVDDAPAASEASGEGLQKSHTEVEAAAEQTAEADDAGESQLSKKESEDEDETTRSAALHAAIVAGSLYLIQRIFSSSDASAFALANGPLNPHTLIAPLHLAASRGRLEIVRFLVEEGGAVLELEDGEGETALHKAALQAHIPVLSYLLVDRNMSPFGPDREGFTALHGASSRGHAEVVGVLLEHGAGGYDPEEALGDGRQRALDRQAKAGWTPLMCAAANGHFAVVERLVNQAGADPLIRSAGGETAADIAEGVSHTQIHQLLEKASRERSVKDTPSDPTNSAPVTSQQPSTLPTTIVWQKDADVAECQRCAKSFGLFVRKHHCRRCAKIYCGSCSSARSILPPGEIVLSPDTPLSALASEVDTKHRVCVACMEDPALVTWLAEKAASAGEAAAKT